MAMASCQTQQPLYSWYDSEDATYTYTKRGTEETLAKAMAQYEKVINKQNGLRKVVPPGVNAKDSEKLCTLKIDDEIKIAKIEGDYLYIISKEQNGYVPADCITNINPKISYTDNEENSDENSKSVLLAKLMGLYCAEEFGIYLTLDDILSFQTPLNDYAYDCLKAAKR